MIVPKRRAGLFRKILFRVPPNSLLKRIDQSDSGLKAYCLMEYWSELLLDDSMRRCGRRVCGGMKGHLAMVTSREEMIFSLFSFLTISLDLHSVGEGNPLEGRYQAGRRIPISNNVWCVKRIFPSSPLTLRPVRSCFNASSKRSRISASTSGEGPPWRIHSSSS